MVRVRQAPRVPFYHPSSDDDDELPELSELFDQLKVPDNLASKKKPHSSLIPSINGQGRGGSLSGVAPIRRRKLGGGLASDSALLNPWAGSAAPTASFDDDPPKRKPTRETARPQRRARRVIQSLREADGSDGEDDVYGSDGESKRDDFTDKLKKGSKSNPRESVRKQSVDEDEEEDDEDGHDGGEDESERAEHSGGEVEQDDEDDSGGEEEEEAPKLPSRSRQRRTIVSDDSSEDEWRNDAEEDSESGCDTADDESVVFISRSRKPTVPQRSSTETKEPRDLKTRRKEKAPMVQDPVGNGPSIKEREGRNLEGRRLEKPRKEPERRQPTPPPQAVTQIELELESLDEFFTPPSTPQKPRLGSPKKLDKIPQVPHGPEADLFWNREFVDDWNDKHSPLKQLPIRPASPVKGAQKQPALEDKPANKKKAMAAEKAAKSAKKTSFDACKADIAAAFIRELDETITSGKLAELTAATGGIGLNWSNKLNTTAGRAHWRRESTRKLAADGSVMSTEYSHHASIEIATKVTDDESRLLNVLAHEFCHLATFMISNVKTNPHGKEFKQWAAKCTSAFADRDIKVTTKHSYDIDFKYVWECNDCTLEYKRHSKSINPDKAICGRCKGKLRQTKPVPRAAPAKPSRYQEFVKEQMKLIKLETPGCPQKDTMKIIAQRWASIGKGGGKGAADTPGGVIVKTAQDSAAETTDDTADSGVGKTQTLLAWALQD